jgi:hypothetical protein
LTDNIETLLFALTNEEVTPEKVTFVAENGFTESASRDALEKCRGDVEQAILRLGRERVRIEFCSEPSLLHSTK